MMNNKLNGLILVAAMTALAGCSTNPSRQEIGTATGAVVGGVAGSVLTGGSTVGTVGGAAVGGVIGNKIGKIEEDESAKAQGADDRTRAKAFIDDSVITAKVKAALVKDKDVSALAVSVETSNGIVLLSGFVENEQQARRAQEIAASISGVKSVKSNLVVKS